MKLCRPFLATVLMFATSPLTLYSQTSSSSAQLSGGWRVVSFGPLGRETPVIEGTSVTLNFGSDGSASGSAGCNSYRGSFRAQGSSITFSRLVSTKRACVDQEANQQEQRYLAALELANRFRLYGDRLTLYYNRGRDVISLIPDPSSSGGERYEDLSSPVGLLTSFYDAINDKDYRRAYGYWETPPGRFEDFAAGYANTESVRLLVEPPVRIEGAAGSLYAEVPTILISRQRNGRERMYVGCYVTRRSNMPSSGNSWRISRASVSQALNSARIPDLLARACRN